MGKEAIKIAVLENMKELGERVNLCLQELENSDTNYLLPVELNRFSNGEGKAKLQSSVRGSDLYILSDVGNYGITYSMHGRVHEMSPDEHYQDIKRVISAVGGHASFVHLFMPLLYQARQHKRRGRESLDCAIALQELERMGIADILTVDAHDPNVSNAIPNLPFLNIYPTNVIIDSLIDRERDAIGDVMVVSPDMGAMERARYYAEVLGCDVGVFYKRRDLSQVIDGKNPIVEHVYMGSDVSGKNIIVVDDMIASGNSMLEVAQDLKTRGANEIYFVATFSLFSLGCNSFDEAYRKGYFTRLYTTNVSYVPDDIKNREWYQEVDCSNLFAHLIYGLHHGNSLDEYQRPNKKIFAKVKKYR